MEISYTRVGDYLLPNIIADDITPDDFADQPLGHYARRRRAYLKEHRPILYNRLLLTGKLYPHLRELDETANERRERGVSEEVIVSELVYE